MYQELMLDVHRQWLAEFDREQALRRQVPRRGERGSASRALLTLLRLRRHEGQPALARRLPQASQCL